MSQIYKTSNGGGGINSVTGTYPVVVNTVGNNANVSLAYGVPATYQSPIINYKSTGNTTIMTVPVGKSFLPFNLIIVMSNAVNVTLPGSWSVGITGPNYLDYQAGSIDVNASNTFQSASLSSSPAPIAPTGTNVIFHIDTAVTATTATGYVIIEGIII